MPIAQCDNPDASLCCVESFALPLRSTHPTPAHRRPARTGRAWRLAVALAMLAWLAAPSLPGWLVAAMPRPAAAQEVTQVTGIRFGIQGARTRVVIDADRPLGYATKVLGDPWRLVVDLPDVVWNPQPGPLSKVRGIARAHRFGSLGSGRGELIVDTSSPFRIVTTVLLPPSEITSRYRLMIDLEPMPAAAFEALAAGPLPKALEADEVVPTLSTEAPRAPVSADVQVAALPPPGIQGRPTATDAPPPIPQLAPRDLPVIVIDAGHGGTDPGAIGVTGTYEKTLTLAMARQLRDALEASRRYRVVLTRDDDIFIPLRERIHKAREAKGQLFISLHADALTREATRGASVYTLSETASDAEAALLASKENKAEIIVGADLRNHDPVVTSILIDLAQRDTNNKSIEFADILSVELAKVTPLLRKHRRFAGFAVLKSPDIPSALVELGYISNAEDADNLNDEAFRAKLARAALRAVDRYFADIKS